MPVFTPNITTLWPTAAVQDDAKDTDISVSEMDS